MSAIRRQLTYANVMSTIAVFAALGAGAAFALPGKNTVDSGDIINGQVRVKDVATGAVGTDEIADLNVTGLDIGLDAVTSAKILNGTVSGADLSDLSVNTADLSTGGVTSAKIGVDAVGADDLANIVEAAGPVHDFGDQDEGNNDYLYGSSQADCPANTVVVSGGVVWPGGPPGGVGADELQAVHESYRAGNGWFAFAASDVDNDDFRAIAYCLQLGT